MGNIIRLPGDRHHETQLLLPWYETGQLDAEDHARVEAHLASCGRCRADLKVEQRLESEIAQLPLDVEQGWAAMRERLAAGREDAPSPRPASRHSALAKAWLERAFPGWLGWAAAASATTLALVLAIAPRPAPSAPYHTLASPAPAPVGNLVVIFRPETQVAAMTRTLAASGARLVDGPTGAGAYVLRAPGAQRQKALDVLRADREVALAEPIDEAGAP